MTDDPKNTPSADPTNASEPVTMTPLETVAFQADLLAESEDAIEGCEAEIATYRAVNEAQTKTIRDHLETIRTMRAALEAAKACLDSDHMGPLAATYHLNLLIHQPADGSATFYTTIKMMNDGWACWTDDAPFFDNALALWIQIWKALNPGREFKKLEGK